MRLRRRPARAEADEPVAKQRPRPTPGPTAAAVQSAPAAAPVPDAEEQQQTAEQPQPAEEPQILDQTQRAESQQTTEEQAQPAEEQQTLDQTQRAEPQETTEEQHPVEQHTAEQPRVEPQPVEQQSTEKQPQVEQPQVEQQPVEQSVPAPPPQQAEFPDRGGAAEAPAASGPQQPVAPAGSGANPTPGLLVASVGALLTFLAAFLVWATVEVSSSVGGPAIGGGSRSVSGLEGDRLGKATLVIAIAALLLIGLLLAPASRRWGWAVLLACGVLIAGLALLDLVSISDASDLRQRLAQVPGCGGSVQCSGDRRAGIGVWLTIAGGAVIVLGAAMHGGLFLPITRRLHRRRTAPTPAG